MKRLLLSALLLAAAFPAVAEKGDAYKQTSIACNECRFDSVTGKANMVGQVVITRGTLRIEADRGEALRAPDGYQSATVQADPGGKVRFRQKSDGPGEQWMEGEAQRVEYDERSDMVRLFNEGRVRRIVDGRAGDEIQGEAIAYNLRTEVIDVRSLQAGGRGTIILQPRRKTPAAAVATTESP